MSDKCARKGHIYHVLKAKRGEDKNPRKTIVQCSRCEAQLDLARDTPNANDVLPKNLTPKLRSKLSLVSTTPEEVS